MASLSVTTTTSNPHFSPFKPTKSHKIAQTHLPKLESQRHQILYKSYVHDISSLCKEGQIHSALNLLSEMNFKNLLIGPEIYSDLLQGCVDERAFFTGQQIHALIVKSGGLIANCEYMQTKLLIFYAKCGILEIASSFFSRLRVKNIFSWAAIVGLHCRMGFNKEALMGFCEMINGGFFADNFVVPNVLKACGALLWIRFGRGIHGYVTKMGLDRCVFVASSLVNMYGKCGILDDARKVFDNVPHRNVVSWNSIIMSYVQNEFNEEAIGVFSDMRLEDVEPTPVTLSGFLSASANLDAIEEGKQGHAIALLCGFELDIMLGSSILNFYSKVGLIDDAELVFSRMLEKDVVTWNLLISGYVQCEQFEKALNLCNMMRLKNMKFDTVTLASILSVCGSTRNIGLGKAGHCYCFRNNIESDVIVASGIINMYAKIERIGNARKVFSSTTDKQVVMWNTLLDGYAKLGQIGEALKLFYQMQLEGVPPNVISWNTLILGFLRNGQVNEAKDMFSLMQASNVHPNLMTFNTLMSGLVQNGLGNEAFVIFQKVLECGIRPNILSIVSLLSICTDEASLRYGRAIHGYTLRHDILPLIPIATGLADMYVKCGHTDLAQRVSDIILGEQLPVSSANDLFPPTNHFAT